MVLRLLLSTIPRVIGSPAAKAASRGFPGSGRLGSNPARVPLAWTFASSDRSRSSMRAALSQSVAASSGRCWRCSCCTPMRCSARTVWSMSSGVSVRRPRQPRPCRCSLSPAQGARGWGRQRRYRRGRDARARLRAVHRSGASRLVPLRAARGRGAERAGRRPPAARGFGVRGESVVVARRGSGGARLRAVRAAARSPVSRTCGWRPSSSWSRRSWRSVAMPRWSGSSRR